MKDKTSVVMFGPLAARVQDLAWRISQGAIPDVSAMLDRFPFSYVPLSPRMLSFKTVVTIKVVFNSLNWLGLCCSLKQKRIFNLSIGNVNSRVSKMKRII